MILSHADADHSGGAASVLRAAPVGWLLSPLPPGHALAGQSWEWDGVRFEVLHPAAWEVHGEGRGEARSQRGQTDALSCTVRIGASVSAAMLDGDIEAAQEKTSWSAALPDKCWQIFCLYLTIAA
ncbi:MAG: hypothetical protein MO853_03280 [Candidatus Protistobacter heckmanni]|nr:hypothetical protein [Candidatus Protistobacter heckmanni]